MNEPTREDWQTVYTLREWQKAFFASALHSQERKTALRESKALEAKVDAISRQLGFGTNGQTDLFEEAEETP